MGDRRGFTLLELMATVAVIGLVTAWVLPGIGATRGAALRGQARELAAHLEFARQHAITSGRPHRLWIDLADGAWRVEWFVRESEEFELDWGGASDGAGGLDLRGDSPLPLAPPPGEAADYRPVPGQLGRISRLRGSLFFEGVGTAEGWIERGPVGIVFDRDGTTDAAEIEIADADGGVIALLVRPLVDVVGIREGDG